MKPGNPLNVLLASERAEDIKQVTLALRRFFPGCRVEAVYSPSETIEWASLQPWHLIILDEAMVPGAGLAILPELRGRAPDTAIIVQSSQYEHERIIQLIHAGADSILYKDSPTSLTELLVLASTTIQKHDLQRRLAAAQERYRCLIDTFGDVAYELDANGRFLTISPSVTALLGYHPLDLVGLPYSTLLHPEDQQKAQQRFNERRTGNRATHGLRLRLLAKTGAAVEVELHASGLYNAKRQFLGTVGFLRQLAARSPSNASGRQPGHGQPVGGLKEQGDRPAEPSDASVRQADSVSSLEHRRVPDRRDEPRLDLLLEATLRWHGSAWHGTVRNLSLTGLYLVLEDTPPVEPGQPMQIGLTSEAGILELRGTIRRAQQAAAGEESGLRISRTGLAIEFSPIPTQIFQVLASLLQELREHPSSIALAVRLVPEGSSDSLQETYSREWPAGQGSRVGLGLDRRLALRLPATLTGQLEVLDASGGFLVYRVRTADVSRGGTCLLLREHPTITGCRVLLRLSPDPTATPSASREIQTTGTIEWIATERAATGDGEEGSGDVKTRLGVRFLPNHHGLREIAHLVESLLISSSRGAAATRACRIETEWLDCRTERGQRLALCHDRARAVSSTAVPLVILAPGFGETKREYIELAYYLAANGCHVLRYDHTNHIGDSDGTIEQSTLSGMKQDLCAILDYAVRAWPASSIAVVARDLAGRAALKAAAETRRIHLLILISGVLDVQVALASFQQDHLFSAHRKGARHGVLNLFGYNVDADRWLDDALAGSFVHLQSTVNDAKSLALSVRMFAAADDPWAPPDVLKSFEAALGEASERWSVIPISWTPQETSSKQARGPFRRLVFVCLQHFYPFLQPTDLEEPARAEIESQQALERERTRLRHQSTRRDGTALRRRYLELSADLAHVPEYWHFLDQMIRLAGGSNHHVLLDAGCGNGHLGLFLLLLHLYRLQTPSWTGTVRTRYVGLEIIPEAVERARQALTQHLAEAAGQAGLAATLSSSFISSLCLADPNSPLPFHDGCFNLAVCDLTVSDLHAPYSTLRELMRVLAPGGRLIVSSLNPGADLSGLFQNRASLAERLGDRTARSLLASYGLLHEADRNGTLNFFDHEHLRLMLTECGAVRVSVHPALLNQATLAIGHKV